MEKKGGKKKRKLSLYCIRHDNIKEFGNNKINKLVLCTDEVVYKKQARTNFRGLNTQSLFTVRGNGPLL